MPDLNCVNLWIGGTHTARFCLVSLGLLYSHRRPVKQITSLGSCFQIFRFLDNILPWVFSGPHLRKSWKTHLHSSSGALSVRRLIRDLRSRMKTDPLPTEYQKANHLYLTAHENDLVAGWVVYWALVLILY